MIKSKILRSVAVTAAAATAGLALAVPAAHARPAAAQDFSCGLFATAPELSLTPNTITGLGSVSCTGTGWGPQKLVVSLEEQLFPTLFVVRAQVSTNYSDGQLLTARVSWHCTSTAMHKYTIETSWYGANGKFYRFRFSPRVTLAC